MPRTQSTGALLNQINDLNSEFLDAVADGDWATATALESNRRTALTELLTGPIEPEVRRKVLSIMNDLLQSDRALVRRLEEARDHCSGQIVQLQLGRVATDSYRDTGMIMQTAKLMQ